MYRIKGRDTRSKAAAPKQQQQQKKEKTLILVLLQCAALLLHLTLYSNFGVDGKMLYIIHIHRDLCCCRLCFYVIFTAAAAFFGSETRCLRVKNRGGVFWCRLFGECFFIGLCFARGFFDCCNRKYIIEIILINNLI